MTPQEIVNELEPFEIITSSTEAETEKLIRGLAQR